MCGIWIKEGNTQWMIPPKESRKQNSKICHQQKLFPYCDKQEFVVEDYLYFQKVEQVSAYWNLLGDVLRCFCCVMVLAGWVIFVLVFPLCLFPPEAYLGRAPPFLHLLKCNLWSCKHVRLCKGFFSDNVRTVVLMHCRCAPMPSSKIPTAQL